MKIDFNRADDLTARMTIVIEHGDYIDKLEENIRKYSKKLNMKGFRAGKTPKSVLTKMYGKGLLEETVGTLLNESLFKYLEDEKIEIFGSPMTSPESEPVHFDPKSPGDYTFIFDIGLKPVFELNDQLTEPLEVMTIETDHDAIEDDIKHYRRVFGKEENIEDGTIEPDDKVSVSLSKIGSVQSAGEDPLETVIDLNRVKGSASTLLPGKKMGDTLEVNLEEFYGYVRESLVRNILKLDHDPDPESPLAYKLEITGITRPQSTELTGEQISGYIGQQVEDEASFRKILEDRNKSNNLERTNDMKKMAVRLALLRANPFEIPEEFLLRWVNSQREKKLEEGSREANNLFREAKWSLLLNRISQEAGLEVTDKDIQKQVTRWIVENVNYTQTDIRKLMKELYANEYFMSTMKENALEDVVFEYIFPKVEFIEKEGTAKEFEHAFHDIHHELFDHGEHSHAEYH
jgi:trigger factor